MENSLENLGILPLIKPEHKDHLGPRKVKIIVQDPVIKYRAKTQMHRKIEKIILFIKE